MRHFLIFSAILTIASLSSTAALAAAEPVDFVPVEGTLAAADVDADSVLLGWTADADRTLSGFYVRLANCVPPRERPTVVALRVNGELAKERVEIPAFPFPLFLATRPFTHTSTGLPPLDVAREFRQALKTPIKLKKGDSVELQIVSSEELRSGVVGGLQFEGRYRLASFRNPFRDARTNGPVCRIPWSEPEVVAVGTQKKFDPLCAPQNNSSIIADPDGTLFQFTAFYSVDEQYGGGRGGSFSRVYGYKKAPDADKWESLGLVLDVMEGKTYSGDPFVFRDLDGTPTLVFTECDGTNGFEDWFYESAYFVRSKTDSFAGPWGEPKVLWRDYPREPDDGKNGGRANCLRIYTRPETKDYVVVWNHGMQDMDLRALILPTLDEEVPLERLGSAPILAKNDEEGGGGFQIGDKAFYTTWQIPGLNDPNGVQRVYEIDLNDPTNPEKWRIVPGSVGFNDGSNPLIDGGCTADSWALSVVGNELWATSCEYSKTDNLNRLTARHATLDPETFWPKSDVFRYGAVRSDSFFETYPTIEYAVGNNCSLEFDFRSKGEKSYMFAAIGASESPGSTRTIFFEVNPEGSKFVAYRTDNERVVLAENQAQTWAPDVVYRLKLVRDDNRLTGFVDGKETLSVEIDDPEFIEALNDSPRFKLYGWQGGVYEITNAVLVDGK